jgi:exonuclease SbcD
VLPVVRRAVAVRILHTSDWHLGMTLGSQNRLDDQFARIAEITAYVERERVDLLLVAGDVFEERSISGLSEITRRLAVALRRPLELGVTIVFVAGNHDRGVVFSLLQSLKALVAPEHASLVHFVQDPQLLQVQLRGGAPVDLVLLPYPTADRYGLDPSTWPSLDAKHQMLADAVRTRLRDLAGNGRRGVTRVLCGHLLLAGVKGGHCEREDEEIPVEPSLPPGFAYVALGHIHKPVSLDDQGTVRYCGSLERMDQGEARDAKSVVLVQIEEDAVEARVLPLHPRALAKVSGGTRAQLEQRRTEIADPDGTLVFATLQLRRDTSLRDLLADAQQIFPLLYGHDVDYLDEPIEPLPGTSFMRADPLETTRAYLGEVLAGDPDRDELLALLEDIVADDPAGARP